MAKKLVIVVGHNGSGKSTLMEPLGKSGKYVVVNLGEVMHDLARKKKLVKHPDQIKELDDETQEDLRNEAVRHVSKMKGHVILDTHSAAEQHGRFIPGLHHYLSSHFKHAAGFLYVDADSDTILKRTNKGKKEKFTINMQKSINLAILSYYSSQLGIPLYVVNNNDGKLEEARAQVSKHLNSIFTV